MLLTSFLFFAHLSVVMYVNATVLSAFVGTEHTTLLYVLGATGSVVLLFLLPRIVQKIGLVSTNVTILVLLAATLLILGTTSNPEMFISIFVLYTGLSGTIWYCNDLFVSHYADSRTMGHTRGSYLTVINSAIALMPIIAGILVERSGFHSIYIVAASLLCIAAGIIAYSQRHFVDRSYTATTIPAAWERIRHTPSLRRVASINFLLQFFYVWMTIFTPLYLATVLHFNWQQIGLAFTCMLTAFVILQYPIGRWADTIGEKRLLVVGFSIASISTALFALMHTHRIMLYAVILFGTRIGICMVEVLAETYFFKQVTDRDEGIVSVYRMMYPLSYIIAPLIGWGMIMLYGYQGLFLSLALLLLFGAWYTLRLVDIR